MVRWQWDWYAENWRPGGKHSADPGRTCHSESFDLAPESPTPQEPSYLLQDEALDGVPTPSGASVRRRLGQVAIVLAWAVGIAAQWWLMDLAYQLVEIVLSLLELWAELARLHLDVVSK